MASPKPTRDPDNDSGIVNPSGIFTAATAGVLLAAVPITSYMTAPGGILQSFIEATTRLVPGTANIPPERIIPALATLYTYFTFGATGAASAAGQAMGRPEGLDNFHPRQFVNSLRGLPLRMRSAHYNMMEMFPGFALAAALTQTMAPRNQQLLSLLGLHVLAKCAIFYPAYLLNVAPARTLAHVLATGAVVNVCWRLATGEK